MTSNIFFIYCVFNSENSKLYFCQILPSRSLKPTISPKFQQWNYFWMYIVHKKFFEFFFWKLWIFQKKIGKHFTKFIHVYRMNVPLLGAWILKIWAFAFKRIWNFLKTSFAIFWIEYAINVKNIVCHVFNGARPTHF